MNFEDYKLFKTIVEKYSKEETLKKYDAAKELMLIEEEFLLASEPITKSIHEVMND